MRSCSRTIASAEVAKLPIGVTLPGISGTVTFKYDPFGRRIEKISPTTTSIFVYDGDNLIETVNSTGSTVARYTQGQNIDEPLAMERGTTVDYYEQDGVGSVTSLTATSGSVTQSYTYDSFGNTVNSSGSLINFFRYTGRDFDTESGLYFYRARYYDPSVGRFFSEDSIRFLAGNNFYRYANNNSVRYRDPDGYLAIDSIVGGIAGGILGGLGASEQGGSVLQIIGGAALGAGVGATVGLLNPLDGIGTMAIVGSYFGIVENLVGQVAGGAGQGCKSINWMGLIGAGLGGGLGAPMSGVFSTMASAVGAPAWGSAAMGAAGSAGVTTGFSLAGWGLGSSASSGCGCGSN